MPKDAWSTGARKISYLMRKDLVEIFISDPIQTAVGEVVDEPVSIGQYKANVTTPPETIDEEEQGNVRTHNYQITLDPDVALPPDKKIFIKIIKSRQGIPGVMLEVSDLQGGLLGQTLNAQDEKN